MICTPVALLAGTLLCGNVAVVATEQGGPLAVHYKVLKQFRDDKTEVRFLGTCASACTTLLTLPAEQLCTEPNAWFGFHEARDMTGVRAEAMTAYMEVTYPDSVRRLLRPLGHDVQWLRGWQLAAVMKPCAAGRN